MTYGCLGSLANFAEGIAGRKGPFLGPPMKEPENGTGQSLSKHIPASQKGPIFRTRSCSAQAQSRALRHDKA
jgi:hypothetical protein